MVTLKAWISIIINIATKIFASAYSSTDIAVTFNFTKFMFHLMFALISCRNLKFNWSEIEVQFVLVMFEINAQQPLIQPLENSCFLFQFRRVYTCNVTYIISFILPANNFICVLCWNFGLKCFSCDLCVFLHP